MQNGRYDLKTFPFHYLQFDLSSFQNRKLTPSFSKIAS